MLNQQSENCTYKTKMNCKQKLLFCAFVLCIYFIIHLLNSFLKEQIILVLFNNINASDERLKIGVVIEDQRIFTTRAGAADFVYSEDSS